MYEMEESFGSESSPSHSRKRLKYYSSDFDSDSNTEDLSGGILHIDMDRFKRRRPSSPSPRGCSSANSTTDLNQFTAGEIARGVNPAVTITTTTIFDQPPPAPILGAPFQSNSTGSVVDSSELPILSENHGPQVNMDPEAVNSSPVARLRREPSMSPEERHETLESTWKAITEWRAMPLTRHIKKCDMWENHGRQVNMDPEAVKKSETLKDRTNQMSPPVNSSPGSRLRKEPSLSQDELNRRVEAFIKNFNEQMRLQRERIR